MTYFPYNKELQEASGTNNNFDKFKNGNFGLWFNKFVPLKSIDNPKVSDNRGNDTESIQYYKDKYRVQVDDLLDKKHLNQVAFCKRMIKLGYTTLTLNTKLKTPLVTGIGESHPHEISLVFDHTLGIPYMPATGIKGVSKLAHIISIIPDAIKNTKVENDSFDIYEDWTEIKNMFGMQDKRGGIIFLDAYPLKTPELKVDVMTPHYGEYYEEGSTTPPADNQNPNPIKFLTIKEGTEFVFRAIIKKTDIEKTKNALKRALTEEGIGAKTALGYGLFEIIEEKETEKMEKTYSEWIASKMSPEEKERIVREEEKAKIKEEKEIILEKIKPNLGQSAVSTLFNEWLTIFNKDKDIAQKILDVGIVTNKKKKDKKNKKGPKVFSANYIKIAEVLGLPLD